MADDTTIQPLSIPDFAAQVKARKPEFKDVPDDVLVRKVLERRPELMKYVQTMEPRPDRHHTPEKTPAGSSQPGFAKRYGEALGVPTTAAEAHASTPASSTKEKIVAGVELGIGVAPVITAAKTAVNYGKLIYDTAANLGKTAKSSYADVKSGKKTLKQGMEDVNQAESDFLLKGVTSLIGGSAAAAGIEDVKNKNYSGLAGDALGIVTLMLLMRTGGKKSVASTGEVAVRESERLASLIDDVAGGEDRVITANTVKPLLRQGAQELGITDESLKPGLRGHKGEMPSRGKAAVEIKDAQGKPTGDYISAQRAGVRRALDVADQAVDIANRPFERIVGEYGGEQVPIPKRKAISDSLRAMSTDYAKVGDTALTNALNGLADTVDATHTVKDLNDLKVHANKELQNLRSGPTPGAAVASSVQTAYAWKITADAIRGTLYPMLEEMSGVNLAKFGARENAAIRFRDGLYSRYYTQIDPMQATEAARGYWRGIAHGSKYRLHMLERAIHLNPMPAGEFNLQFRKGLGKIGEGTTAESIKIEGRVQKRLGGSTAPTKFSIPGDLPQEIVTGSSGADPAMSYAGQQTVLNRPPALWTADQVKDILGRFESLDESFVQKANNASYVDAERLFHQYADERDALIKRGAAVGSSEYTNANEKASLYHNVAQVRAQEGKASYHEPLSGGSRYQQRLELGTTEGTVPESVFNRTPPKVRQDEVGKAGSVTPERSFTGPETRQESRWQYLTGAKEPTQEVAIKGHGMLQTTDPKMAYSTLQRLKALSESQEFMKYPFEVRERVRDAMADLNTQLQNYVAYRQRKAPRGATITPAKPGFVRPPVKGPATVVGLHAEQQANQLEAQP